MGDRYQDFTNRTFFERLTLAFEHSLSQTIRERASSSPASTPRVTYVEKSVGVSGRFFRLVFFFTRKEKAAAPTPVAGTSRPPSEAPSNSTFMGDDEPAPAPAAPSEDDTAATSRPDDGGEGMKDIRFLHATVRDWFGPEAAEQGALILSEPIEGSEEARPLEGQPQAAQASSALSLAVRHLLMKSLNGAHQPPSASDAMPADPTEPLTAAPDLSEVSEQLLSDPVARSLFPFTAVALHFDRASTSRALSLVDVLRGRRVALTGLMLRTLPSKTPGFAEQALFKLESSSTYDVRSTGESVCNPSGSLRAFGLLLRSCWAEDSHDCMETAAALEKPRLGGSAPSSSSPSSLRPWPLTPRLSVSMSFRLPLAYSLPESHESNPPSPSSSGSKSESGRGGGFPSDSPDRAWDDALPWKRWVDCPDPFSALELELIWRGLSPDQVRGKEWSPSGAQAWRLHLLPARLGTEPQRDASAESALGFRRAQANLADSESEFATGACFKPADRVLEGTLVHSLRTGLLDGVLRPLVEELVPSSPSLSLGDLAGEDLWEVQRNEHAPRVPPEGVLLDLLRDILGQQEGEGWVERPWEVLLHRIALHSAFLKNPRAMAFLWMRAVREFRLSYFDQVARIPDVFPLAESPSTRPTPSPNAVVDGLGRPFASASGPAHAVDHSKPPLFQKLQLLDMCLARRMELGHVPSPQKDLGSAPVSRTPSAADLSPALTSLAPRGVASVSKNLKLLYHPSEPLRVPEVVDPLSCTTSEAVAALQPDQLDPLRVASLASDMSAFKAANPGSVFEDFVRWFSPRDFSETGELSQRMSSPGNIWQTLWEKAKAVPVREQRPLIDPKHEGERILHSLEHLAPLQLAAQLSWAAADAVLCILEQTCRLCVGQPSSSASSPSEPSSAPAPSAARSWSNKNALASSTPRDPLSDLEERLRGLRRDLEQLTAAVSSSSPEDLCEALQGLDTWTLRAFHVERLALVLAALNRRMGVQAMQDRAWVASVLIHLGLLQAPELSTAHPLAALSQPSSPLLGVDVPTTGSTRHAIWTLLVHGIRQEQRNKGIFNTSPAPAPLDQSWCWELKGHRMFVQWTSDSRLLLSSTVQMKA